jgi:hypothetical protein
VEALPVGAGHHVLAGRVEAIRGGGARVQLVHALNFTQKAISYRRHPFS